MQPYGFYSNTTWQYLNLQAKNDFTDFTLCAGDNFLSSTKVQMGWLHVVLIYSNMYVQKTDFEKKSQQYNLRAVAFERRENEKRRQSCEFT